GGNGRRQHRYRQASWDDRVEPLGLAGGRDRADVSVLRHAVAALSLKGPQKQFGLSWPSPWAWHLRSLSIRGSFWLETMCSTLDWRRRWRTGIPCLGLTPIPIA